MTSVSEHRPFSSEQVTDRAFWARSFEEREESFRRLRDTEPVSWQPMVDSQMMPSDQPGMWVVTRHEHIAEVSRATQVFSSGLGVQFEDVPEDLLEASHSFLAMDAPRHGKIRKLVSSAFTPRQVARTQEQVAAQAESIVDDLLASGDGDFCELVSKRLPMWTLYEMVGLGADDREQAAHLADRMVGYNDPEIAGDEEPADVVNGALVELLTMGLAFAEERRHDPRNDLMTNLVQAEVDGERLTDDEIAAFFVLLSVAGNDTTRNTISLSAKALQDHPDQRDWLMQDYDGRITGAIEEFVRFASPVMTFRRTALSDTTLGGVDISAGDWVGMVYASGNRDERVFTDPHAFDLSRNPNPHQGFGGGGPHFCMGNFVAKMQLREIFRQLLHRAPTLEVGEPSYLSGNFVRAVKSLPATL